MYFLCCAWHHFTQWPYDMLCISEWQEHKSPNYCIDSSQFCSAIKTSNHGLFTGLKSAIYDCLVIITFDIDKIVAKMPVMMTAAHVCVSSCTLPRVMATRGSCSCWLITVPQSRRKTTIRGSRFTVQLTGPRLATVTNTSHSFKLVSKQSTWNLQEKITRQWCVIYSVCGTLAHRTRLVLASTIV